MTNGRNGQSSPLSGLLRLEPARTRPRRGVIAGGDGDTVQGEGGDANYYNKLITLFPAEALTLFGTGLAVFGSSTLPSLIVCLAVLLFFRWQANKPKEGGKSHWLAVIVALISFLLWTTATDPRWLGDLPGTPDDMEAFLAEARKWATFLGTAFVFVAPALVKAPPPEDAAPVE